MHTGIRLGAAIEAARIAKRVSKKDLALRFGVSEPSVQGWVRTGRIAKDRLAEVMAYFSDTVDASHWGLAGDLPEGLGEGEPVIRRMVVASQQGLLKPQEWKLLDDLLAVLLHRGSTDQGSTP